MKYYYLLLLTALLACEAPKEFSIDQVYLNKFQEKQTWLADARIPYLQLAGLYKLDRQTHTFGLDTANTFRINIAALPPTIGTISVTDSTLSFAAAEGVEVMNEQDSSITALESKLDEFGSSTKLHYQQLVWQVITRGGELFLRLWDLENPVVDAFEGFDRYDLNPNYIFEAQFTYYAEPKSGRILSQLGANEEASYLGQVTFNYQNEQYNLDILGGGFTIVGDKTNDNETYGGGRYMYIDLPKTDSLITLDFNYLYNPPCTFSEFTTCPLPPKQNIMPFEIKAGEKYEEKAFNTGE